MQTLQHCTTKLSIDMFFYYFNICNNVQEIELCCDAIVDIVVYLDRGVKPIICFNHDVFLLYYIMLKCFVLFIPFFKKKNTYLFKCFVRNFNCHKINICLDKNTLSQRYMWPNPKGIQLFKPVQ